jgi:hypothetical protein
LKFYIPVCRYTIVLTTYLPFSYTLSSNLSVNHHLPNCLDALLDRYLRHLNHPLLVITLPFQEKELTPLSFFNCSFAPSDPSSRFGRLNSNAYVICKSSFSPDGPSEIIFLIILPSSCSKSTCTVDRPISASHSPKICAWVAEV